MFLKTTINFGQVLKEWKLNKVTVFELGFFVPNKAKSKGIASATASIFNELRGKKGKSKMILYLVFGANKSKNQLIHQFLG